MYRPGGQGCLQDKQRLVLAVVSVVSVSVLIMLPLGPNRYRPLKWSHGIAARW